MRRDLRIKAHRAYLNTSTSGVPVKNIERYRELSERDDITLRDVLEFIPGGEEFYSQVIQENLGKLHLLVNLSGRTPEDQERRIIKEMNIEEGEWEKYAPLFSKYMPVRAYVYIPIISTHPDNLSKEHEARLKELLNRERTGLVEKIGAGLEPGKFIKKSSIRRCSVVMASIIAGLPITNPYGREIFTTIHECEDIFRRNCQDNPDKLLNHISYPLYYYCRDKDKIARKIAGWLGIDYRRVTELLNKIVELMAIYEIGGFEQYIGMNLLIGSIHIKRVKNRIDHIAKSGKKLVNEIHEYTANIEEILDRYLEKREMLNKLKDEIESVFKEKGSVDRAKLVRASEILKNMVTLLSETTQPLKRIRNILDSDKYWDLRKEINFTVEKMVRVKGVLEKIARVSEVRTSSIEKSIRKRSYDIEKLLSEVEEVTEYIKVTVDRLYNAINRDVDGCLNDIMNNIDEISSLIDDFAAYAEEQKILLRRYDRIKGMLETTRSEVKMIRRKIMDRSAEVSGIMDNVNKVMEDIMKISGIISRSSIIA